MDIHVVRQNSKVDNAVLEEVSSLVGIIGEYIFADEGPNRCKAVFPGVLSPPGGRNLFGNSGVCLDILLTQHKLAEGNEGIHIVSPPTTAIALRVDTLLKARLWLDTIVLLMIPPTLTTCPPLVLTTLRLCTRAIVHTCRGSVSKSMRCPGALHHPSNGTEFLRQLPEAEVRRKVGICPRHAFD